MKKLTFKEQLFVDILTSGEMITPTAAAKQAGYTSNSQGAEMIRKPHIADAIEKARKKSAKKFTLSQDRILEQLWTEAQEAAQGSARIKALELLGKHFGLWKETEKESQGITYNIVNYQGVDTTQVPSSPPQKVIEHDTDTTQVPNNIEIKDYSND